MFSVKISGLFKKLLGREGDDHPGCLSPSVHGSACSTRCLLPDGHCGSSLSAWGLEGLQGEGEQGFVGLGGLTGGWQSCGGTCAQLSGRPCPHCSALLATEGALCPDALGSPLPSVLPPAEPLCCCERCSWLLDCLAASGSRQNPPLPASGLEPRPRQPAPFSATSNSGQTSRASSRECVRGTGRRLRTAEGLERCAALRGFESTTVDGGTSVPRGTCPPVDARLSPRTAAAGPLPAGTRDDGRLSSESARLPRFVAASPGGEDGPGYATAPLPRSVAASLDGEEGYATALRRLARSNRLRKHVSSLNFEVGCNTSCPPPNKTICHVVR